MSILDRKPVKYSTSDLFWEPSAAPTDGAVGDTNTMKLDPSHLGMVQDMIIDTNGVLRSRGAYVNITSDSLSTFGINGIAQGGTGTIMTLNDSGGASNFLYGTSAQAMTGFAKLTVSRRSTGDAAQGIGNNQAIYYYSMERLPNDVGQIISTQSIFFAINAAQTYLWGGNAVTTSDTVAGTAASTIGSAAVVGVGTAWTTALNNCYLFIGAGAAAVYVGQVKSVTSTTALTLYKGALRTVAAAAPAFKTARPPLYMVYKGRVTTNAASTIVVGANTKFLNSNPISSSGTPVSTGNMFRNSDGAYIGTVTSVQNDTTLTLTANAAIALTNEEYYICDPATLTVDVLPLNGFSSMCACYFADRYWYGGLMAADGVTAASYIAGTAPLVNLNAVAFTKKNSPELLDLDPNAGDIITLPLGNRPDMIRMMMSTRAGMLIFRQYDTFLLTGYSPETFKVIRISDDGCFNCHTAKHYSEGVVWAGVKSIWYFDGTRVIDLLQNKIKRFYQKTNKANQNNGPPGLAISNDHVMCSYPITSDQTWPYKNTVSAVAGATIVLNMLNGAISFFTNIYVTTSFQPKPATTSSELTSVIVTRCINGLNSGSSGLATPGSGLLIGNKIFTDSSTSADNFDAFAGYATFGTQRIGPDWMFESVKLSLGNAARLKFWKMLLMNYSSDVSAQATIIGTNDTTIDFPNRSVGTTTVATFPVSSNVGVLKRVKFLVRAPQLVIRVYQTNTVSATSQRFKLYWYAVGGKWMRWGRQQ